MHTWKNFHVAHFYNYNILHHLHIFEQSLNKIKIYNKNGIKEKVNSLKKSILKTRSADNCFHIFGQKTNPILKDLMNMYVSYSQD